MQIHDKTFKARAEPSGLPAQGSGLAVSIRVPAAFVGGAGSARQVSTASAVDICRAAPETFRTPTPTRQQMFTLITRAKGASALLPRPPTAACGAPSARPCFLRLQSRGKRHLSLRQRAIRPTLVPWMCFTPLDCAAPGAGHCTIGLEAMLAGAGHRSVRLRLNQPRRA